MTIHVGGGRIAPVALFRLGAGSLLEFRQAIDDAKP